MIVRNPKKTWTYVLEADRKLPRDQQTIWTLRHLTLEQEHEILDIVQVQYEGERAMRYGLGAQRLTILRRGLAGFTNLRNSDGTEVAWEANANGSLKDEILLRIPMQDRMELSRAIESELHYDPDEAGKSEPPSEPGTAAS